LTELLLLLPLLPAGHHCSCSSASNSLAQQQQQQQQRMAEVLQSVKLQQQLKHYSQWVPQVHLQTATRPAAHQSLLQLQQRIAALVVKQEPVMRR
jgi:glutaredoxin-related protein